MGIPLAALAIQPPPDPLRQIGQALAIKGAVQNQQYEAQAQPLRLQQAQQQIAEQQDVIQSRQALRQAYAGAVKPDANGQPQIDTDELTKALASSNHGDAIPGILENINKYQKSKADLVEQAQKIQAGSADMIGHAAAAVKAANYDPNVAHTILDTFGNDPKVQQMRQLIDSNPQAFKQQIDSAIAASPAQQKMQNEQDVAKIRANNPSMQEMNDWLAKNPGKGAADFEQWKAQQNPEQRELNDYLQKNPGKGPADFAKWKASLAPTATFNLQNAGLGSTGGQPSALAQAVAANRMKWSDVISPRTPAAVKEQFAKEVLSINPQFDTSEFQLETKAAEKARSGSWADTRLAYNTALDHSDLLLQAAKALQNGDVRTLNSIKNKFNTEFGGSGQVTFDAIANAYNHEVTSVVSKGHITDSEVASGHATLPDNANFDTIKSVVGAYKGLMSSKRDELDKIIKAGAGNKANGVINTGSSSGGYTPPAGAKTATGPNGHKIVVDNGKWVDAETGKPL